MNTKYIYTDGLDSISVVYYYEMLREKIYSIIYYLRKSIDSLDEVDQNISLAYKIDEEKVDNILIEPIKSELVSRLNYLNYTIIPLLNSKINGLN